MTTRFGVLAVLGAVLLLPVAASAQMPEDEPGEDSTPPTDSDGTPVGQGEETVGAGQPSRALPPPQSDDDTQPPVASPMLPESGVTEQAGVGGTQAYGRAGVLELGGNLGFAHASGFTSLQIAPTIGYFFMDNIEISGIIGFNYINADGDSSTHLNVLAEPSLHIPFTQTFFGFVGAGMGLSYASGPGVGFALAPRLGVNVMVGRSGVFTPALQMVYSTTEAVQTAQGTLLAVHTSFGVQAGYTVMW